MSSHFHLNHNRQLIDIGNEYAPPVTADTVSSIDCSIALQKLSKYKTGTEYRAPEKIGAPNFVSALGFDGVDLTNGYNMWDRWEKNENNNTLKALIGTGLSATVKNDKDQPETINQPFWLDFADANNGGSGPHFIVQGITGSGKSHLYELILTSLFSYYSPLRLNTVFIDLKGGSTFLPFKHSPHTLASLTNFEINSDILHRFHLALSGELTRREKIINDYANVDSLTTYRELAKLDPHTYTPIPDLLIIVDELSLLLEGSKENQVYGARFEDIGKAGRAYNIHLCLASQRLNKNMLPNLWHNISTKISLAVAGPNDSRNFFDDDRAAGLPKPGFFWTQYDTPAGPQWFNGRTFNSRIPYIRPDLLNLPDKDKNGGVYVGDPSQILDLSLASRSKKVVYDVGEFVSDLQKIQS